MAQPPMGRGRGMPWPGHYPGQPMPMPHMMPPGPGYPQVHHGVYPPGYPPQPGYPAYPPLGYAQPAYPLPVAQPPLRLPVTNPAPVPAPSAVPIPTPSASAPSSGTSAITINIGSTDKAPASDWSEATSDDGRKYYFNKLTRVTTWEKPNELKTPEELAISSSPWKEYTNAETGKKYYYNHITQKSAWEMPSEYKDALDKAKGLASKTQPSTTPAQHATNTNTNTSSDTKAKADTKADEKSSTNTRSSSPTPAVSKREQSYGNKDDAWGAFKQLLADMNVGSTVPWDSALKHIICDDRYKALSKIADKKAAFLEYQVERRKTEQEDRRRKEKQVRTDFLNMLREAASDATITARHPWRRVSRAFMHDPRHDAVEDERDREDLYDEFVLEMERQDLDARQREKQESAKKFKQRLEEDKDVTSRTQWRRYVQHMENDPQFRAMDKLEALRVFEGHIRELEAREAETDRVNKERQRRDSRKARDAFRQLLNEHYAAGDIVPKTRWREFVKGVVEDERYVNLISQPGSMPHELFGDFIDELEENIHRHKKILKEIFQESRFVPTKHTTYREFEDVLQGNPRVLAIPRTNLTYLHAQLVDKAGRREQSHERKRRKLLERQREELRAIQDSIREQSDMTWESVCTTLPSKEAYEKYATDPELKAAFDEIAAGLRSGQDVFAKDDKNPSSDNNDRSRGRESKKDKDQGKDRGRTSKRDRDDRGRDTKTDDTADGKKRKQEEGELLE
eukprot:TRINITY_DN2232_c0_g1_i8.p1 TRINITY_DN2232_c0_g1~~TRINITY_DN2232_c0_g1_i8.p1  ORF type:complete len:746 (-),score=239.67 TRINITY_DN2232_c0_g1_i8:78-2294(-)